MKTEQSGLADVFSTLTQAAAGRVKTAVAGFEGVLKTANAAVNTAEKTTAPEGARPKAPQPAPETGAKTAIRKNEPATTASSPEQSSSTDSQGPSHTQAQESRPTMDTKDTKGTKDLQDGQDQLAAAVAQSLGLEVRQLKNLLVELDMVPLDLADPANRTALIMAIFELDQEAQLLSIPQALDIQRDIAAVLEAWRAGAPEVQEQTQGAALPIVRAIALPQEQQKEQATSVEVRPTLVQEEVVQVQAQGSAKQEGFGQGFGSSAGQADTGQTPDQEAQPLVQGPVLEAPRLEMTQQQDGTFLVTETTSNQSAKIVGVSSRPTSTGVNQQEIIRQLTDTLRMDTRGGNITEIRMTLRPENLGEVSMKVASENGIVTASFVAENSKVKEAIEANMDQLRQALAEKGIEVSQLSVSVQTGAGGMMRQFLAQQGQAQVRARAIRAAEAEPEPPAPQAAPMEDSTVAFSA